MDGQRNSASLGFTASDGTSVPEPNPAKGVYFGSGSFYSGPGSKPFKETDTTIFLIEHEIIEIIYKLKTVMIYNTFLNFICNYRPIDQL